MESNSEALRVHCSEHAARLAAAQDPDLQMELRGEVAIKGKGSMTTYWVNGTKPLIRVQSSAAVDTLW